MQTFNYQERNIIQTQTNRINDHCAIFSRSNITRLVSIYKTVLSRAAQQIHLNQRQTREQDKNQGS